jgi:hypothetical protein
MVAASMGWPVDEPTLPSIFPGSSAAPDVADLVLEVEPAGFALSTFVAAMEVEPAGLALSAVVAAMAVEPAGLALSAVVAAMAVEPAGLPLWTTLLDPPDVTVSAFLVCPGLRKEAVVNKRAANKVYVFLISGSYYILVLLFDNYNTKIGTLYCIEHCFMLGGRFY